jgi:hypothetical protein
MRSLKANLLPRLCPSAMCASSCDNTAARLPSSGRVSIRPRLTTIVLPTLKVSSGEVSITRVANGTRQVKIVGDDQVVDDGRENFVDIAFGGHQSGFLQALDHIVLGLLLPFALRFQRRSIVFGSDALVFYVVNS